MTTLIFDSLALPAAEHSPKALVVVAQKAHLSSTVLPTIHSSLPTVIPPLLDGTTESVTHYYNDPAHPNERRSLSVSVVENNRSRHNAVVRADTIADAVAKAVPKEKDTHVVVFLDEASHAFPVGCAIARIFPLYTKKGSVMKLAPRTVVVDFVVAGSTIKESGEKIDYHTLHVTANAIRFAARIVDAPPNELNVSTYITEISKCVQNLGHHVEMKIIRGEELRNQGFGGLWNVGKASDHMPALVHLSYTPESGAVEGKSMVFLGKGIVYDSGGLSIKGKDHMPGMKVDMGGSAAALAGFQAVVQAGYPYPLHAVLCLAENSVSDRAYRPDDIITAYSGKTVEINNTDAEGRVVLMDGIAYSTKHLNPQIIIDLATLTGAQAYATGHKHCGVLSNSDKFESIVVSSGKKSGDLAYPLIYSPEYLGITPQFNSQIADMKNSVKDRSNAPSSCAGHFIEEHICGEGWKADAASQFEPAKFWAHLDIAYPVTNKDGRGTGFGVALLVQIAKELKVNWPLKN